MATLGYLQHHPSYATEKPYELYIPLENQDQATSNVQFIEIKGVPAVDVREDDSAFNLTTHGFKFLNHPTAAFHVPLAVSGLQEAEISRYLDETIALVSHQVSPSKILLFDWRLRSEDVAQRFYSPTSTDRFEPLAVANIVHQDYSPDGGWKRLKRQLSADEYATYCHGRYHIQIVNVWRPLVPVVETAPLGICDKRSVSRKDLETVDKVHPDHVEEGIYGYYNPNQKWFYKSRQTCEDVLLFVAWDSRERFDTVECPPHAAMKFPDAPKDAVSRQSIEVRLMLFFEEST